MSWNRHAHLSRRNTTSVTKEKQRLRDVRYLTQCPTNEKQTKDLNPPLLPARLALPLPRSLLQKAFGEEGEIEGERERELVREGCRNVVPQTGALNNRNVFSPSSGDWRSEIKVSAGLVLF